MYIHVYRANDSRDDAGFQIFMASCSKIQVTIDDIYVLCVYLFVLVFILTIISWDVYALLFICGPQHYSMIVLQQLFNTMDSFLSSFENLWLLMFYFFTADSLRNLQLVSK